MEALLRVKDVADLMGCSYDTARTRMESMPGVMNVGSEKRRQLMVPAKSLEDWVCNHKIHAWPEPIVITGRRNSPGGRIARINRRTGKLEKKKGR